MDVIMSAMASRITSLTIVYSAVHSDADQGKLLSSASLAFVREIHQWPGSVTRKMFHLMMSSWFIVVDDSHHFILTEFLDFFKFKTNWNEISIQCALDLSRSFFFEVLTNDTPYLAFTGEIWGVVLECKVWRRFYHCNYHSVCIIVF